MRSTEGTFLVLPAPRLRSSESPRLGSARLRALGSAAPASAAPERACDWLAEPVRLILSSVSPPSSPSWLSRLPPFPLLPFFFFFFPLLTPIVHTLGAAKILEHTERRACGPHRQGHVQCNAIDGNS